MNIITVFNFHYLKINKCGNNVDKEEMYENNITRYYTTELLPVKKYEPASLTWLVPSEADLTDSIALK